MKRRTCKSGISRAHEDELEKVKNPLEIGNTGTEISISCFSFAQAKGLLLVHLTLRERGPVSLGKSFSPEWFASSSSYLAALIASGGDWTQGQWR